MGVVDREFPEPGSADQYLEALKVQIEAAADKLKLMVGQEGGGGGGRRGGPTGVIAYLSALPSSLTRPPRVSSSP